jgi:hypothetical protein
MAQNSTPRVVPELGLQAKTSINPEFLLTLVWTKNFRETGSVIHPGNTLISFSMAHLRRKASEISQFPDGRNQARVDDSPSVTSRRTRTCRLPLVIPFLLHLLLLLLQILFVFFVNNSGTAPDLVTKLLQITNDQQVQFCPQATVCDLAINGTLANCAGAVVVAPAGP